MNLETTKRVTYLDDYILNWTIKDDSWVYERATQYDVEIVKKKKIFLKMKEVIKRLFIL